MPKPKLPLPLDYPTALAFLQLPPATELTAPLELRTLRSPPRASYVKAIEAPPPDLALFAAVLVLKTDERGTLTLETAGSQPLPAGRYHHLLWVAWGALAGAADTALVLARLALAPYPGVESYESALDPFAGVTGAVLRAVRPAWLINEVAEHLAINTAWAARLEEEGRFPPRPELQRAQAEKLRETTRPRLAASDANLAAIARRYLQLTQRGIRTGIHKTLATEFGLTEQASRSRIARARRDGLLAPTRKGRANATPGAREPE